MMTGNVNSPAGPQHAQHDRRATMESIRRTQRGLECRVRELEKEKKEVLNELKLAEQSLFAQEQLQSNFLTLSMFLGYTLTDYDIRECEGNVKILSAACKDNINPFKINVTMQGEIIEDINVSVPNHSSLSEVGKQLDILSEERNPSVVLMTIQQFISLNRFREKVMQRLISSGNRNIQVYTRQYFKEHGKDQTHTIYLYNTKHHSSEIATEIQWSIMWDPAQQALTHHLKAPVFEEAPPMLKQKLMDLRNSPSMCKCEDSLLNWWEDLRLNVIKA